MQGDQRIQRQGQQFQAQVQSQQTACRGGHEHAEQREQAQQVVFPTQRSGALQVTRRIDEGHAGHQHAGKFEKPRQAVHNEGAAKQPAVRRLYARPGHRRQPSEAKQLHYRLPAPAHSQIHQQNQR